MKYSILAILFIFQSFYSPVQAQIKYSEYFNLRTFLMTHIGSDDASAYYVIKDNRKMSGDIEYIKVDMNTGVPTIIEKPNVKINDASCILQKSILIDGEIYELYCEFNTSNFKTGSKVFLLKRNTTNFDIIKTSDLIVEHRVTGTKANVEFWANENGIFLHGKDGQKEGAYLKVLDDDLNVLHSENFDELYPKDTKPHIKNVYHEKSGYLMFKLNLNTIKKKGTFMSQFNKSLENSALAFIIFDGDGNRQFIVPKIENSMIYSHSEFFFDEDKKTLSALFSTHKRKASNSTSIIGMGYAYFKWDLEDGSIIDLIEQQFNFSDMITPMAKKMLKTIEPKMKEKDDNLHFPRLDYIPTLKKLSNGDHLMIYKSFVQSDFETVLPSTLYHSRIIKCISKSGKQKWTLLVENLDGESQKEIGENETTNQYLMLVTGRSINYPGKNYKFINKKGKVDLVALVKIDLETGEVVSRKSIDSFEKSEIDYATCWNKSTSSIMMVIQKASTSSSYYRKLKFGVLTP